MTPLLDIVDLARGFERDKNVLDGVTFSMQAEEVVALLGRNGTGKTTLVHMIMGMLRPDRGSVRVFGLSPFTHPVEVKRRIGYVGDQQILPARANIPELLALHRMLYPSWDRSLERALLERFGLAGNNQKLAKLSKGQVQQAALLMAVCHRPELLLLDELREQHCVVSIPRRDLGDSALLSRLAGCVRVRRLTRGVLRRPGDGAGDAGVIAGVTSRPVRDGADGRVVHRDRWRRAGGSVNWKLAWALQKRHTMGYAVMLRSGFALANAVFFSSIVGGNLGNTIALATLVLLAVMPAARTTSFEQALQVHGRTLLTARLVNAQWYLVPQALVWFGAVLAGKASVQSAWVVLVVDCATILFVLLPHLIGNEAARSNARGLFLMFGLGNAVMLAVLSSLLSPASLGIVLTALTGVTL